MAAKVSTIGHSQKKAHSIKSKCDGVFCSLDAGAI